MSIARHYDESKNPDGAALPGVPLGDIEQDAFDAYPEWLQRSIDACGFYRKTPTRESSKPATNKE
jgi:hypothetical protein